MGEVSPDKVNEIKKRLGTVKFKPFTANLQGVGVFPSEEKIRVVWAGVEPHELICEIQQKIDKVLEGIFAKEKDFQPHLTLARVKTYEKKFFEQLKQLTVEPLKFEVSSFKLVESKLEPTGPIYKDVVIFQL